MKTAAILGAVTSIDLPILLVTSLVVGATVMLLLVRGYQWLDRSIS
ncbi:MAG: hypothetical protein ABGW87_03355 [Sphingomonadaceae bacterium]